MLRLADRLYRSTLSDAELRSFGCQQAGAQDDIQIQGKVIQLLRYYDKKNHFKKWFFLN
jgi:hypothetical protein